MDLDQLKASFQLDNVRRFPTHWTLKEDRVSQHAYRATLLYAFMGGKELLAMLTHDNEESVFGDIPSPAKKYICGLETFNNLRVSFIREDEKLLGKLADKLDLVVMLEQQKTATGILPPKLQEIYELESQHVWTMAGMLDKSEEVMLILGELGE